MKLEDVLADCREDAALLRAHGHKGQPESMERVCDRVAESMRSYLEWLSEAEAHSRSGRAIDWLRGRFADWEAIGMAERRGRARYYRAVIVPRRANLEAARADARREASQAA